MNTPPARARPAPARIVDQRTHFMTGRLKVTEHIFEVPLDYSHPTLSSLRLFARSVQKVDRSMDPLCPRIHQQNSYNLSQTSQPYRNSSYSPPWILFLQGGPGFGCTPPQYAAWSNFLLDRGYQVLHLDQRGTGLSSPVSASVLSQIGDVDAQVEYLRFFRADSIVYDCEAIRQALLGVSQPDRQKWSLIGLSFGGFCSITYLSFFPHSLREVFLLGGLAPIGVHPDQVYSQLYHRVMERNVAYYQKYPEDVDRVKRIVRALEEIGRNKMNGIEPSGGALTPRRFQQLGILFGGVGGIDTVHDIVLRCTLDLDTVNEITWPTLRKIDQALPYNDAVIYSILHEQLYCEGFAPRWSAERIRQKFPCFRTDESNDRIFFTGEMMYPWMFEDYAELRPLAALAHRLAEEEDWPELYDKDQLRNNPVPVYAAVFVDDMYVDYELSRFTAEQIIGAAANDPVLETGPPHGCENGGRILLNGVLDSDSDDGTMSSSEGDQARGPVQVGRSDGRGIDGPSSRIYQPAGRHMLACSSQPSPPPSLSANPLSIPSRHHHHARQEYHDAGYQHHQQGYYDHNHEQNHNHNHSYQHNHNYRHHQPASPLLPPYIAKCHQFITNTMHHDAIRSRPEQVLSALFNLKEDVRD